MTGDHDALLRAVCEHPREDTPRLVFADWLEENGQAELAQFIRSDIAMSLRDEWDADRLRWEWVGKPAVRRALWFQAMFPPLPRGLKWGELVERGFPAAVEGGVESFRANAVEAFRLAPVNAIAVSANPGGRFTSLTRAPWFGRVRRFGVPPQFDVREMAALAHSQFALGITEVVTARAAHSVSLVGSELFPRLTRVRLTTEAIRGLMIATALGHIAGPVGLRSFELAGGAVWPGLLHNALLLGVEHLRLGGCHMGPNQSRELAAAPFPRLRSLDLARTHPGAEGVRALCGSAFLAGLRDLRLGGNVINSTLAREFATSPGLANLRVLGLASNAVGNDGGAALFTSPHLAGLKVLDLSYCMIGDDVLRALLDDSPLADGLVFLNLTGSPASAEMKQAVKDRMGDRVRV